MTTTSRAGPERAAPDDGGMVTIEAAVALCAFIAVFALALSGLSMLLDQLRCTDAAWEAARLVARNEPERVGDAVHHIAAGSATFVVRKIGDGIVVSVQDPAAGGLLPGVRVGADAFAVPEPDSTDEQEPGAVRPTEGGGR